jgi:putative ATPase
MDLFDFKAREQIRKEAPLAARMRPCNFDEFVGNEEIAGKGRALRTAIECGQMPSIILWGPPGSGKTTLAFIIAGLTSSFFAPVSAVAAGVADLRKIIEEAKERRRMQGQRTILFIDEIHRFNKSQQDVILPYVEDGTVTLIGATTENPSFEVNSPLLSRSRVYVLKPLSGKDLTIIIRRALADPERGLGAFNAIIDDAVLSSLITMSNSDARIALNTLEMVVLATPPDANGNRAITPKTLEDVLQHRSLVYDRAGEQHYDIISALHKTMRGSDPDAALYWLARMLEAGEDPLYVARRLVRFASEDVGLADPQALVIAMAAEQAVHFIGMPEGKLALAEAVIYLATAPKSNALYTAYTAVAEEVKKGRDEPVPLHLRNAVTSLMKDVGYGEGYKYAHDFKAHFVAQQNLPDSLKDRQFYYPGDQGFEREIGTRIKVLHPDRQSEAEKRKKQDHGV